MGGGLRPPLGYAPPTHKVGGELRPPTLYGANLRPLDTIAPGKNEKTKKRKKLISQKKNGQGIEKYQKMVREGALPTD